MRSAESSDVAVPLVITTKYLYHFKVLRRALRKVVARRNIAAEHREPVSPQLLLDEDESSMYRVREIIPLLPLEPMANYLGKVTKVTGLDRCVEKELAQYITEIAALYQNDNQFHSFDHATQVMKAVEKIFDYINTPASPNEPHQKMHERTYGIAFDPLVQFTCLLAALVHDADHPAVPNGQFILENPDLIEKYNGESPAEKISLDHAWNILMEDRFSSLRSSIYGNTNDFERFRHLLVNAVMGTDAFDSKLVKWRKDHWARAFRVENITNPKKSMDRKATIVIHYILLAADISHTMSSWETYCTWNQRLFFEMTAAWQYGRSENEPGADWYNGEIGFFKGWVVPLAEKLKSLGIFGDLGEMFLLHATTNLRRWEKEGVGRVRSMEVAFEEDVF